MISRIDTDEGGHGEMMKRSLEGCVNILMTASSKLTKKSHFTDQSLSFPEDENIDEFSLES